MLHYCLIYFWICLDFLCGTEVCWFLDFNKTLIALLTYRGQTNLLDFFPSVVYVTKYTDQKPPIVANHMMNDWGNIAPH